MFLCTYFDAIKKYKYCRQKIDVVETAIDKLIENSDTLTPAENLSISGFARSSEIQEVDKENNDCSKETM